jgi:hypothetical protein
VTQLSFEVLVMFHVFEWCALMYLIVTQRNRRIEEILYDHSSENINEKIINSKTIKRMFVFDKQKLRKMGKLNLYRKQEICIDNFFRWYLMFYVVKQMVSMTLEILDNQLGYVTVDRKFYIKD